MASDIWISARASPSTPLATPIRGLLKALTEQAGKLWHTSNLYRVPGQESLSQKLVANTFADTCFFTNSGTEAIELAIKMARRYHFASGHPERFHIITFEGAFHGRTYAAINAGGNEKYLEGFGPRMPGFIQLAAGDLDAVKKAIGPETAAILIEPLQGESGVRVIAPDFLQGLAQAVRRARPAADLRRDPDRAWPHRQVLCL